jgi:UDP-N-acetylmuramoyl-tripeptide--D-alanyl-D-alanine ligase
MIEFNNGSLTIGELTAIVGGIYTGNNSDKVIRYLSTDTRDIGDDSLFIAIKGERVDGHDFIGTAIENGAACVLCEKSTVENIDFENTDAVIVNNTLDALAAIAKWHKNKTDPLTIAVTGSVGKTTTREFIYAVLSEKYSTLKTEGNLNTEIGLPKTLLMLKPEHNAAVLELGMSGRGEIEHLSKCAEPDIAVITNIGVSHIEYLGSRENIRDAKMEITQGLKSGGKLVLNGDEPLLANIDGAVYVSMNDISDIRECDTYTLFNIGEVTDLMIPVIGKHNILDAAFAYKVGKILDLADDEIRRGLAKFHNTGMRQNIYDLNGYKVIEDCYNAAPESMEAAISVLNSFKTSGKKIAILGEMRELGNLSTELHTRVGKAVSEANVDILITFGTAAIEIANGAVHNGFKGEAHTFIDLTDVKPIGEMIKNMLSKGDIILFKASRAIQLERIINYLKGE